MFIGFNKYQIYGKMAILTIFFLVLGLFIFIIPPLEVDTNSSIVTVIFLGFIGFLILLVAVLMTLQLLFLPNGANIDNENKFITLSFFAARPCTIATNDLINFSSTLVKTKSTNYGGILLNLKDGKKYLLSDFNLKNYKPIKSFLEECNVTCIGHEKFSFIAYFIKYFKT